MKYAKTTNIGKPVTIPRDDGSPIHFPEEIDLEYVQSVVDDLKKGFFDETIANSEKMPHNPNIPYIPWYSEKFKEWRRYNPDGTFTDWILYSNQRINKNKWWRITAEGLFALILPAVGLTAVLTGMAVFSPLLIPIIVFGALHFLTMLYRNPKMDRDTEGRKYLMRDMQNKCLMMLADIKNKHYNNLSDSEKQKFDLNLQNMAALEANMQRHKQWDTTGWRTNLKKFFGFLQTACMVTGIIGAITGAFPFYATLIVIFSTLVVDIVCLALYYRHHGKRVELMKENSRTIQEITGVCLEFYQKYGKIQNEQGESVSIKNIEDLKNARDTLKTLEVERNIHLLPKCKPNCNINNLQEENSVTIGDILSYNKDAKLLHTHAKLIKPLRLVRRGTQKFSQWVDKSTKCKPRNAAQR